MTHSEEIKMLEGKLISERKREREAKDEIEIYKSGNKDYSHLIPRLQHIQDRIEVIEYRIGQLKGAKVENDVK